MVEVENLLAAWQRQYTDLGNRPEIGHVLVFENRGEVVGVSKRHVAASGSDRWG